ncbi:MAG: flagellar motor protein MotB [Bacteroidota bacterium]
MSFKIVHKPRGEEQHWQVSYIDLLTAMIAAFTLLLAMSKPDQAKLDVFAAAADVKQRNQENLQSLAQKLHESIKSDTSLTNQVSVVLTEDGIELRFLSSLLFAIGKAKLQPDGYEAILKMMPKLQAFVIARKAYLAIEGHTDDQPIIGGKEFKSNWELSVARANEVVHMLQDSGKIDVQRLSAVGFADARPANKERDPETGQYTAEARAANRRVVIRIYYYTQSQSD